MKQKYLIFVLAGTLLLLVVAGCQQHTPPDSTSSQEASVYGVSAPSQESISESSLWEESLPEKRESSMTDEEIVSSYLHPSRAPEESSQGSGKSMELPIIPVHPDKSEDPASTSSPSSQSSASSRPAESYSFGDLSTISQLPKPIESSVPPASSVPAESSAAVSETTETEISLDPDETEIIR